jgi:hypothetical protein
LTDRFAVPWVRLEVTKAVLNHISGSRAGIAGVYQRHDWAIDYEHYGLHGHRRVRSWSRQSALRPKPAPADCLPPPAKQTDRPRWRHELPTSYNPYATEPCDLERRWYRKIRRITTLAIQAWYAIDRLRALRSTRPWRRAGSRTSGATDANPRGPNAGADATKRTLRRVRAIRRVL